MIYLFLIIVDIFIPENKKVPKDLFFFSVFSLLLRKNEVMEEEYPDKIEPAEDRDDDTEDEAEDVAEGCLFDNGSDTDEDFDDPVDNRDKKKDELNQSRKRIKPFHN